VRPVSRIAGRTALLLLLLVAIAALVFHGWTAAQGRALIVLSRASNTPLLSWAIGVGTDEPRAKETVIAGQPAYLVEPGEGSSWPAIVFLNGVTRRGRFHPTVRRLARALARAGYLVAVPDPPGLRNGTLTPATLAGTTAVVRAIAARPDVRGGRVALLGVSVGASLALLAAERPGLVHRVREVAGLAPYSDLVQVVRLVTTGAYRDRGTTVRYRTKPFAALVVARSLAAALSPGRDRSLLLRVLEAVPDRARHPLAALRAIPASSLGQPARRLVRVLLNRDSTRFDSLYAELPRRVRQVARMLSPIVHAVRLQTQVLIASAPHDKYFPPAETRALAARAPHVSLTVTTTLQHAVPHFSAGDLAGLVRFDGFLVRVLHAAG
jgi:pimeloyl-ACP methyl ester carboxylesterase